jgi:CBS domain-containing protein
MTLAAILKQKEGSIISVTPTTHISEVVAVLAEKRIGAVVILDETGRLLGILSERDIVRSLASNGARTLEMTAAQLMTRSPTTATSEITVYDAEHMMTNGRFRHLPIVDDEKLIGMVSIGDVVKAVLDAQTHEMDNMRSYVTGIMR